jgi:hypothetical protein
MRGLVPAQHHGYPAHALAADETNFDPRLVCLEGDNRRNTRLHKIDSVDPAIGAFNVLQKPQRDGLQVWE